MVERLTLADLIETGDLLHALKQAVADAEGALVYEDGPGPAWFRAMCLLADAGALAALLTDAITPEMHKHGEGS